MSIKNTFNFPSGAAFVIGGSGGIGKEICLHFAANNVPVIFTYHNNKDSADKLIEEISSLGSSGEAIQLSLENRQDVITCFEKFKAENKKIHTIVNAAGSNIKMEWIGNLDFKDWDEIMHADSTGFFNLVKSSLPWMRECQGSYIAITSIGLSRWPTRDVLSVAPKSTIDALITGIAREEGKHGIRANSVQLGIIEAGIFLRIKGKDYSDEYIDAAIKNTALKRLGRAEDVANAVIFLASENASYITGQALYLDGGFRI
jgi:NAD(P)-dependent dehydrogenase (short-subunit alcohol dehydrogenase family)